LQKVWDWAIINLTTEELTNKLLLSTDNEGMTAWHWATQRGNLDVLQKVWDWAIINLTTEEVTNKLLLSTDNEGMTAGHWATQRGNLDALQKYVSGLMRT